MTTLWKLLISWLVWLSADPAAIDAEPAKAAAAVAVARASMAREAPTPDPDPAPACKCGGSCVKGVWKPDGHIQAKCDCQCQRCVTERAKASPAPCPDGKCPQQRR